MAKPRAKRGKRAHDAPALAPYSADLHLADECRRLAAIPFPPPARLQVPAGADLRTGPVVVQLFGFLLLAIGLMTGSDGDAKPRTKKPPSAPTAARSAAARPTGAVIDPMKLPDAKPPRKPVRNRAAQPRPPASSTLPGRR